MKKLVSLLLAVVLMVSMFAMLGSFTASAESYEISKTLVNLTFDGDAPYGIAAHRGAKINYDTENGYLMLTNTGLSNGTAYFGINGNVGATPVAVSGTDDVNAFTAAQTEAYNNLFKFEAGKTYRISYNYKFLAGTDGDYRQPGTMVMHNPLLKTADSNRTLTSRVTIISKDDGGLSWTPDAETGKLTEDTAWDSVCYEFTVKDDDAGFTFGIGPGQRNVTGQGIVSADTFTAFDNIKIEELLGSYSYSDTGVFTMDEELTWVNGSGAPAAIVDSGDTAHGKVVKVSGTANTSRGGFSDDAFVVTKGKKYYISFDAKADATGYLNTVFTKLTASSSARHFFSGYNIKYGGVKYYVNGVEKVVTDESVNADVFPVTTEWATYGLVIDTASSAFETSLEGSGAAGYATHFWKQTPISFGFGANTTAYFDNIKIVAIDELDAAAPEADESAKYSIREADADKTAGLRFRGTVAADVKATADEIGFVVVPADLALGDADWYKLDSLNASAKTAKAYVKDGKDVVYEETAEGYSYQLILSGLSNAQGQNIFARRFAAVMYVKTGDAYSYISLGEISYNQVMAEYAVRGY